MKALCPAMLILCTACVLPADEPSAPAAFDPARAAEMEALRREETRSVMNLNLKRAEEFHRSKRHATAALFHEEVVRLARDLGNVKAVAKDVAKAREGIVDCSVHVARALQEQDYFKEADEVAAKAQAFAPDNRRLRKFRKSNEYVRKAHIGRVPSREVQAAVQGHRNQRARVMTLVRDGRAFFELGQYGEAEKRLKQAVKLDPHSDVAYYYLRLILEAEYDREGRARDLKFNQRVIEIANSWNR